MLVRDAPDPGFTPLSAGYLRAVERVEALPGNRSGADKSWVLRQFRAAMRVRAGARVCGERRPWPRSRRFSRPSIGGASGSY